MTHKEIQSLLLRHREGKCTEEESVQIHKWYNGLNKESLLSLSMDEHEEFEERILNNIWKDIRDEEESEAAPKPRWWRSWGIYSVAAAASLILVAGYFFTSNRKTLDIIAKNNPILIHTAPDHMMEVKNDSDKEKSVTLEDNSIVVLSPGSSIVYPDHFQKNRREVQLVGDAFFEISKNPKRPFCVYSGNLITKVLGTSFRIKSKSDDQGYEVEVLTGKVSVFENKEIFTAENATETSRKSDNGVILTPNQKATYFAESRHMVTGIVENPILIASDLKSNKLVFNNTQLTEIISGLQQEYGIEIVVANEDLENCSFTGDLTDLPLYEKLDLICKSNSAAYEVKGTRILITGAGCQDHANIN